MKAQGLVFLGVRTAETDVMAAFFTNVMGFPLAKKAHDFVRFQLPNRDQIELFGPPDRHTGVHRPSRFESEMIWAGRVPASTPE